MEESFLRNVLRFYSEENSLSTGNLENFLHLITSRRAASVDDDSNPLKNTEVRMCPISDIYLFISLVLLRFPSHYNITRQAQFFFLSYNKFLLEQATQVKRSSKWNI